MEKDNKTITADVLNKGTTPLVLPEKKLDTTASDIFNKYSISDEVFKRQNESTTADTATANALKTLYETEAKQGQYEQDLGVGTAREKIADIDKQIYGITKNFKAYQEGTLNDPNIVKSVASGMITEEQRKSASTLADLEFAKGLAEGSIERMQKSAKDKVALETAPLRADLENKKLIAERNWDRFSKAEQAQMTTSLNAQEKELDRINKEKESSQDMIINAMSSGAPTSITSKAQELYNQGASPLEIAGILKDNILSPKEKLELQKLQADITNTKTSTEKMNADIVALNQAKQTLGGTTNDPIQDIVLASSKYDKTVSDGFLDDYTQAMVTLGNVSTLQSLLNKEGTGILAGNAKTLLSKVSGNFANAGEINAQIQRTVPGLARGIFKEVGVLTDTDINNYKKTLPNLTSPEQKNKLALLMTLDVIERSIAQTLKSQAQGQRNVSQFNNDYVKVKNQVSQLKSELGFIETTPISPVNKAKMEEAWSAKNINNNISKSLDSFFN